LSTPFSHILIAIRHIASKKRNLCAIRGVWSK